MLAKDIVYMVLDMVKSVSDDSIITEEHVLFLCKKYRSFLIKKELDKEKETSAAVSDFEYQQICLDLEKVEAVDGLPCEKGYYLRSTKALPKLMDGVIPRIYPVDYFSSAIITFISMERMRFTGTNPFLQNILYVSVGPDLHLYINSSNPQFQYLEKLRVNAVFEDFEDASELSCDNCCHSTACGVLEAEFPIRDYLVPTMLELIEKEILGTNYRMEDKMNNAKDDLPRVNGTAK